MGLGLRAFSKKKEAKKSQKMFTIPRNYGNANQNNFEIFILLQSKWQRSMKQLTKN